MRVRCVLRLISVDCQCPDVTQFLEGMRIMRSDAVAAVKRNGEEIFNLPGINFKSVKVRRENTAIKALLKDNKFLTSTSPADKIRPLAALRQPGPSGRRQKNPSGLASGYLYHPCILRVRAARCYSHHSSNVSGAGNACIPVRPECN